MPYVRVKSKPLARFKIPFDKKAYIHAYIWNTREELYANTRDTGEYEGYASYFPAVWRKGERRASVVPKGKIGEIHFLFDRLGAGHVAHELEHVLLYFVADYRLNIGDYYVNERVSNIMGQMNKGFWTMFYENFEEKKDGKE